MQVSKKKFLHVPPLKGSCSSLSSGTLWGLYCSQRGTGYSIFSQACPLHLEFLNPMALYAYSHSSRTLFGPEPWASTCQEEMLPAAQMEKTISIHPALLGLQVIIEGRTYFPLQKVHE